MWSRRTLNHSPSLFASIAGLLLTLFLTSSALTAQNIQGVTTIGAASLSSQYSQPRSPQIRLGIDVLESRGFDILKGQRVGLLTHPAGVNRNGVSTITILHQASAVDLTTLYGPEHGIYGDEKADVPVFDRIDPYTGLHVHSLYGKYRKPTPEMLQNIDTLVIDLQDVGARTYTFISCMKLALEACIENGKAVVILDRPNPLGGIKVDGPILEKEWMSYVGSFQLPYVHGLTIGELARMAVSKPGILAISDTQRASAQLTVVTMDGWKRYMSWPQTGLIWKPTSPFIPTFEAVVGYPMTGLGAQLGGFKHGIGSEYPFRTLRYEGVDLAVLEKELKSRKIPGIAFERKRSTQGEGLYVKVVDWNKWRPTELSFHMMLIAAKYEKSNPFSIATESQANLFNKHVGSSSWWTQLVQRGPMANIEGFMTLWQRQAKQFQIETTRYWLYD